MNINFKLSDSQKHDLLFNLLNPNFNEEGGWMIECVPCEIYDDYALVLNYADTSYERVYYSKNDADDKIEITARERCYIVDVNTAEKEALTALKGEGTFAQAVETRDAQNVKIEEQTTEISSLNTQIENLTTENQNYSTKVGELEENISTLTTERDNVQAELHSAQETVNSLGAAELLHRHPYSRWL